MNQVRNPEKVKQIVSMLGQKHEYLTSNDLDDLRSVLPEADKNMFLQFRDGIITLD